MCVSNFPRSFVFLRMLMTKGDPLHMSCHISIRFVRRWVEEEKFSMCLWWCLARFTRLYRILRSQECFHSSSWHEEQRIISDYHCQQWILLGLRGKEVMETEISQVGALGQLWSNTLLLERVLAELNSGELISWSDWQEDPDSVGCSPSLHTLASKGWTACSGFTVSLQNPPECLHLLLTRPRSLT